MSKLKIFLVLAMTIFFISVLLSCGSTAPFAERDKALKSIDLAKTVEADKFAPDDFDSAILEYDAGEELIVTEGKSKKNDKAKIKYIEADKLALSAYDKSVGSYIEGFILKTEEEIEKARAIKVDIARQEQFNLAVSKNRQAREEFEGQRYDQSKITSLEAYDIIMQAQSETLELKEQAMTLMQEYEALLAELKKNKAEAAIPNEYTEATENYNSIQSQLEEGHYENVMELCQDGIIEGEDLLSLIEEKRLLALQALKDAEMSIEETKSKVQEAENE